MRSERVCPYLRLPRHRPLQRLSGCRSITRPSREESKRPGDDVVWMNCLTISCRETSPTISSRTCSRPWPDPMPSNSTRASSVKRSPVPPIRPSLMNGSSAFADRGSIPDLPCAAGALLNSPGRSSQWPPIGCGRSNPEFLVAPIRNSVNRSSDVWLAQYLTNDLAHRNTHGFAPGLWFP
jgi:hypothetical protein